MMDSIKNNMRDYFKNHKYIDDGIIWDTRLCASYAAHKGLTRLAETPHTLYTRFAKNEPKLVNKLMQDAHRKGLVRLAQIFPHTEDPYNAAFSYEHAYEGRALSTRIEAGKYTRYKPGTIAHEIGHAQSIGKHITDTFNRTGNAIKAVNSKPMIQHGPGIARKAFLINMFGNNLLGDKTKNIVAGVGAASMLPLAAEETKASINGYKLLRRAGKGRLGALATFTGLGSYLMHAASPFIPNFMSKLIPEETYRFRSQPQDESL